MTAHSFLRDDATFAALLGGDLPAGGAIKISQGLTRDMTAASGNVAYTGIGFQPSAIVFFGIGGNGVQSFSIGTDDASTPRAYLQGQSTAWFTTGGASVFFANPTAGDTQSAKIASFDADGFTLTWTKAGSPTGTALFTAICFR